MFTRKNSRKDCDHDAPAFLGTLPSSFAKQAEEHCAFPHRPDLTVLALDSCIDEGFTRGECEGRGATKSLVNDSFKVRDTEDLFVGG